jgi:hypothetical protein
MSDKGRERGGLIIPPRTKLSGALWLFVFCPKTNALIRVTGCLKCDKYVGQMFDGEGITKTATSLNCELLEN